uniref:Uncharacterized protein n=1 Tax=Glossina brevipalpis TaxID=37001 RepID=A0A1A9W983_9MUSC
MATLENVKMLVEQQKHNFEEVRRHVRNFKKDSKSRYNLQYFEWRLDAIQKCWERCEQLHHSTKEVIKQDAELHKKYIEEYEEIEDIVGDSYILYKAQIADYHRVATVQPQGHQPNPTTADHDEGIKLERLRIPKFIGDYTNWTAFHDLFKVLVHENRRLSGVPKLQYLRSSQYNRCQLQRCLGTIMKQIQQQKGDWICLHEKVLEHSKQQRKQCFSYKKDAGHIERVHS